MPQKQGHYQINNKQINNKQINNKQININQINNKQIYIHHSTQSVIHNTFHVKKHIYIYTSFT